MTERNFTQEIIASGLITDKDWCINKDVAPHIDGYAFSAFDFVKRAELIAKSGEFGRILSVLQPSGDQELLALAYALVFFELPGDSVRVPRPYFDSIRKTYVHPDGSTGDMRIHQILCAILIFEQFFPNTPFRIADIICSYKEIAAQASLPSKPLPFLAGTFAYEVDKSISNVTAGMRSHNHFAALEFVAENFRLEPGHSMNFICLYYAAAIFGYGVKNRYKHFTTFQHSMPRHNAAGEFTFRTDSFKDDCIEFAQDLEAALGQHIEARTMYAVLIQYAKRNRGDK